MSQQSKKVYRFLAWFFCAVIAAGIFIGCSNEKSSNNCGTGKPSIPSPSIKYGCAPITPKYGCTPVNPNKP